MELLATFFSLFIPAIVPILVYALRKQSANFIVSVWIIENRDRFVLCGVLLIVLALGLTFVEGFSDIFTLVGLGKSTFSLAVIGAMVGGYAVAGMKSRK